MQLARTLQNTLQTAGKHFAVVLVTGPRQVGKTTLLQMLAQPHWQYVTLDDLDQRTLAQTDPALFLQRHPAPLIIDEIQYAPQLFAALKLVVDEAKKPGQYWLTGSQKFHLMKGVSESLAGRVAVLDLLGLSQAEARGKALQSKPFIPTPEHIATLQQANNAPRLLHEVYQHIWRGSFPQMQTAQDLPKDLFYKSYVQTYIQRDVRDLIKVESEGSFNLYIRAVAARTAQLLNYADLARDVGIDQKTAKAWLSVLQASGLVYLLEPYHNNLTKRLVKTPKVYFLDTGLCTYLTQWPTPQALEAGALSGAIFETYVVAELLKSYWHNGQTAYLHFYRDTAGKEVDLLIEQGNTLYPIEIKKTATPSTTDTRHFQVLQKLGKTIGHGAVICLKEQAVPLNTQVTAVPLGYL